MGGAGRSAAGCGEVCGAVLADVGEVVRERRVCGAGDDDGALRDEQEVCETGRSGAA